MRILAALLEQRTGQHLAPDRSWRIESALKPLLRAQGIESLDALVGRLTAPGTGSGLADAVVDALLNQETSFFRDVGVLDSVPAAAESLKAGRAGRPLRIWSAGCATGQEPLSLAMLFAERGEEPFPDLIATDVSEPALARARRGRYSQFEIQRGLPVQRMLSWFESVDGDWVASRELTRRIRYFRHNLATDPPLPGGFDIILCRNVLLYFPPPLRRRVLDMLALALRPDGVLLLGAGETVIGQTERLRPCERFRGFYRRAAEGRETPRRAAAG